MLIDRLRTMAEHGTGVDTETYLLRPGNLVPPLVLGSVSWWDGQEVKGALLTKDQTVELWRELLLDVNKILVGANLAFDLAVLVKEFAKRGVDIIPWIFQALMGDHTEEMTGIHDGRIYDIQHAEALNAIAHGLLGKDPRTGIQFKGRYSQERVVKNLFNEEAKENDEFRLRYGEFDGVPLEQLPWKAQQYPVDDTNYALKSGLAQCGVIHKIGNAHSWGKDGKCTTCGAISNGQPCWIRAMHYNLHDLAAQTASHFCAHMGAAHGFRIDQNYVDVILDYSNKNYNENIKPYKAMGLIRADGSEDRSLLKKKIAIAHGSSIPCPVCQGTGKVPSPANPKSKINCFQMGLDGITREKTCDGTGLTLHPDTPLSEKGGIAYGRSNLTESGDEELMNYASVLEDKKIRDVYGPGLRTARLCVTCDHVGDEEDPHVEGCAKGGWRDIPYTLRPNPILDTKRMSYDSIIMLLPRAAGKLVDKTEVVNVPDDYVLQEGEQWI